MVAAGSVVWQTFGAEEASRALASKDFLLDMFRQSDPEHFKSDDAATAQLLVASRERANRQLSGQPELLAEVLTGIANIEEHWNRYGRAHEIFVQVASIYERLGKQQHRTRTLIALADNAVRRDDINQADAFIDQACRG